MAKKGNPARAQLPLRITQTLRARMEKAAKSRGVSRNAEIIERLERSFETEDRLGPRVVELIEAIATVMKLAGEHAAFVAAPSRLQKKGSWIVQPWPYKQARDAAEAVLKRHRPRGKIVEPSEECLAFGEMWVTEDGPPELTAEQRQMVKTLGRMFAAGELKKREQDDE